MQSRFRHPNGMVFSNRRSHSSPQPFLVFAHLGGIELGKDLENQIGKERRLRSHEIVTASKNVRRISSASAYPVGQYTLPAIPVENLAIVLDFKDEMFDYSFG